MQTTSVSKLKKKVGRPKLIDREFCLQKVMELYWENGPLGISVNKICKELKVSKPAFYREFGSEDLVMAEVLQFYFDNILFSLYTRMYENGSIKSALFYFGSIAETQKLETSGINGCLFTKMLEDLSYLGPVARAKIVEVNNNLLEMYRTIIVKAKLTGELSERHSSEAACSFLHHQIMTISAQRARKESPEKISEYAKIAFSIFNN